MKILIVNNNMKIGGIQKSLVNLLHEIHDKHDVTLFLFHASGGLLDSLPDNLKVITGNKFTKVMGMTQAETRKDGIFSLLWRTFCVLLTRLLGIKASFSLLCRMQKIREPFDIAISFMQNSSFHVFYGGCNEFVLKSTEAQRKIAFVHCDFINYEGNNPYNLLLYQRFDKIACVSDSCKKRFNVVSPKIAHKTCSVHNCYRFQEMEQMAAEYKAFYTQDVVNIFTAARISREKGIIRMIPIFANLKKSGCRFVWRIAGEGPEYQEALELQRKYGLEQEIVFLGMLKNPYPYFESSDLLLVPSFHEAAPMVFGEAAFFGIPVLTTETASADELVSQRKIGWVCKNDNDSIETALKELLFDKERIMKKRHSVLFSNAQALSEFDNLISEGEIW